MDVKHLSTTLIQGWSLCPARSWDEYATRNEEGDGMFGPEPTRFGSVVHSVCERYHGIIMRGEEPPAILELFDDEWKRHECFDLDYYRLGRDSIQAFIERTLFDRFGDTVGVEVPFVLDLNDMTAVVLQEGDDAKKAVLRVLEKGHVPVFSKIDRIDSGGDGRYYIYDYKTNVVPFTRAEVDGSVQLGIYDLAVRAIYDDAVDVVCTFDMLRHGRFSTTFGDDDREALRQYLINLWHQILRTERPEERLNKYCRYCTRRASCATYADVLSSDVPPVLIEDQDNPDELWRLYTLYEEYKDRIKLIESRADEIKEMLVTKIVEGNGGKPMPLGDKELYLGANPRYEYPVDDVWEVLQRRRSLVLLRDVVSISRPKLERVIKGRPELEDEILPMLITTFAKPTLRARKLNKKEILADDDS